jgi:hypothetical protein
LPAGEGPGEYMPFPAEDLNHRVIVEKSKG